MVTADPSETRRELEALASRTRRLPELDLAVAQERVERQSVLFLLQDRAALGRRCGFSDEEIAALAGVSPELVAAVLAR